MINSENSSITGQISSDGNSNLAYHLQVVVPRSKTSMLLSYTPWKSTTRLMNDTSCAIFANYSLPDSNICKRIIRINTLTCFFTSQPKRQIAVSHAFFAFSRSKTPDTVLITSRTITEWTSASATSDVRKRKSIPIRSSPQTATILICQKMALPMPLSEKPNSK